MKGFLRKSLKELTFSIWNEVVDGYTIILTQILPPCLNKYLVDNYDRYLQKYALKTVQKEKIIFEKSRAKKASRHTNQGQMTVFSTTANDDPTKVTEDEYVELMNQDLVNTNLYKLVMKSKKEGGSKHVLWFLAFIKEDEPEFLLDYDQAKAKLDDFEQSLNFWDVSIENYKGEWGIPLELEPEVHELYSLNEEVSYTRLIELKSDHEASSNDVEVPLQL